MSRCRSCGEPIVWASTKQGKKMPLNAKPVRVVMLEDGSLESGQARVHRIMGAMVPHFATCPNADQHRRRG